MDSKTEKVKNLMKEMKTINKLINTIREEINAINERMTDISVHYKNMPLSSGNSNDAIGTCMPKLIELEQELEEYIQSLTWRKKEVLRAMKKINPKRQQVLILYYMQDQTIEETAEKMGKSYTWTFKELKKAEQEIAEQFPEI